MKIFDLFRISSFFKDLRLPVKQNGFRVKAGHFDLILSDFDQNTDFLAD